MNIFSFNKDFNYLFLFWKFEMIIIYCYHHLIFFYLVSNIHKLASSMIMNYYYTKVWCFLNMIIFWLNLIFSVHFSYFNLVLAEYKLRLLLHFIDIRQISLSFGWIWFLVNTLNYFLCWLLQFSTVLLWFNEIQK